jgi:hypothetical protein
MLGYGSSPPPWSTYGIREEVTHLTGSDHLCAGRGQRSANRAPRPRSCCGAMQQDDGFLRKVRIVRHEIRRSLQGEFACAC